MVDLVWNYNNTFCLFCIPRTAELESSLAFHTRFYNVPIIGHGHHRQTVLIANSGYRQSLFIAARVTIYYTKSLQTLQTGNRQSPFHCSHKLAIDRASV